MPSKRAKGPEALMQDAILDWLAAERILAFRMNTGATVAPETTTTRRRFIVYGVKGMADIQCFPDRCKWCRVNTERGEVSYCVYCRNLPKVLWIEVKSARGSQSPEQRSFESQVKSEGHGYLIARSLEDVMEVIA